MRVSAKDVPFRRARVFTADSVEVCDVLIADDALGYVLRYRRGPDGRFVFNPQRKAVETEELWVPVFIEIQRQRLPEA